MNEEKIRAAFEKFMSDDGKWPQAIERCGAGNYILSQSASSWRVWRNAYHQCLQSPEIQALREDAELFRFIMEESWFQSAFERFDPDDKGTQAGFESECRRILRAAMENQP